MITDPASGIKREVLQLIDLQIDSLKQDSSLDFFQLQDYQARSERIQQLYGELDRIRGSQDRGQVCKSVLSHSWHHRRG
jgi:hypothetical protein